MPNDTLIEEGLDLRGDAPELRQQALGLTLSALAMLTIPPADLVPGAEPVPWRYDSPSGPTYYRGANVPIAVVMHVAQGWASTSRQWATAGHYGASYHLMGDRKGGLMQHLGLADGGYHAGITADKPRPSWKLWRGYGTNINTYTIGYELEGFSGEGFPAAQLITAARAVAWLLRRIGQPVDRDHVIGHFEVDSKDRPLDPGPTFPWGPFMEMVRLERAKLDRPEEADMAIIEELREENTALRKDLDGLRGLVRQVLNQLYGEKAGEDFIKAGRVTAYETTPDKELITLRTLANAWDRFARDGDIVSRKLIGDHTANHYRLPNGDAATVPFHTHGGPIAPKE